MLKESWADSILKALDEARLYHVINLGYALSATQVFRITRDYRERKGIVDSDTTRRAFHRGIQSLRKAGRCVRVGRGYYRFLL